MKLFFGIFVLGLTASTVNAQDLMGKMKDKAKQEESTIKANPSAVVGNNGPKIKDAIMSKLVPALKLTDAQKTKVGDAIDGFLN